MERYYSSSKSNEWATPQQLFDELNDEFGFTLDPCCTHENARCEKHYTKEENGLSRSWQGEVVFMNPPYGREIGKWVEKAFNEWQEGNATVVCLIPARTDTRYWQSFIWDYDKMIADEVRFIPGRIHFENNGKTGPATFPSALVIFKNKTHKLYLQ